MLGTYLLIVEFFCTLTFQINLFKAYHEYYIVGSTVIKKVKSKNIANSYDINLKNILPVKKFWFIYFHFFWSTILIQSSNYHGMLYQIFLTYFSEEVAPVDKSGVRVLSEAYFLTYLLLREVVDPSIHHHTYLHQR